MGKARGPKKNRSGGPYLDAALICEDVIQEKDYALTPVRLVNRLTIHDQAPSPGVVLSLPLLLLISFKAGDICGERKFSLYLVTPSGKRNEFLKDGSLKTFDAGDSGANAVIHLHLPYESDGTYWIEVVMNRKRYSRVPLTLLFKPNPD